ncbi:MAG: hypothetical protein GY799_06330 [Desulfobulbaceae bacterium]|nr:hypothetical protein [Desulfobulbaceae bacterium]
MSIHTSASTPDSDRPGRLCRPWTTGCEATAQRFVIPWNAGRRGVPDTHWLYRYLWFSVEESYANDSSAPFFAPIRSVGRVTVATDRISGSYRGWTFWI